MTNEQAIKWIKQIQKVGYQDNLLNHKESLDMAIKALEQEPILDKIRAEITAISINGQVDERTMFVRAGGQVKQMVLDIIDKYKGESEDAE